LWPLHKEKKWVFGKDSTALYSSSLSICGHMGALHALFGIPTGLRIWSDTNADRKEEREKEREGEGSEIFKVSKFEVYKFKKYIPPFRCLRIEGFKVLSSKD
jgi:hypothetical protein